MTLAADQSAPGHDLTITASDSVDDAVRVQRGAGLDAALLPREVRRTRLATLDNFPAGHRRWFYAYPLVGGAAKTPV